jgi:hypothetical protein
VSTPEIVLQPSLVNHPKDRKTGGSLDQPANPKVGYSSLSYKTHCLIVVDTFRPGSISGRQRDCMEVGADGEVKSA